jgi:hypothetical protein
MPVAISTAPATAGHTDRPIQWLHYLGSNAINEAAPPSPLLH